MVICLTLISLLWSAYFAKRFGFPAIYSFMTLLIVLVLLFFGLDLIDAEAIRAPELTVLTISLLLCKGEQTAETGVQPIRRPGSYRL